MKVHQYLRRHTLETGSKKSGNKPTPGRMTLIRHLPVWKFTNTKEDHCTLIILDFIPFYMSTCYNVFLFLCFINKVVVGSGSEGTPKYAGEGVTYRVFLGYYSHFFACVHHLTCHIRSRTPSVTTSWYYVMCSHHIEHWWHHFMTSSWCHRLSL